MSTNQVHDILSEIEELPELIPLPTVASTLLSASQDPNVGARELCQIVSCDMSLSIRLLQLSNSARYGMGGQIKTVEHASVVLGARGLRDLAMSIVAQSVFSDSKNKNPSVDALWQHSLGCATVARAIAENMDDVCPDEAFVTGIVHDVGKLVLVELLKDEYDLIPKALSGNETVDDEQTLYGVCHTELGKRCAEQWGLPHEIRDALMHHHSICDESVHSGLSSVVLAANQLSKAWRVGNCAAVPLDSQEIISATNLPFDEVELAHIQEQSASDYLQNKVAFQG